MGLVLRGRARPKRPYVALSKCAAIQVQTAMSTAIAIDHLEAPFPTASAEWGGARLGKLHSLVQVRAIWGWNGPLQEGA